MPVSRRRSKANSNRIVARTILEVLETRRLLTVDIWTGGATTGDYTDGANWSLNAAPTNGETAQFPAGVANTTVIVDSSNISLPSAEFDSSYTVNSETNTSDALTLTGTVFGDQGDITFNCPIVLPSSQTIQADDQALINLNGVVSDGGSSFGIIKTGNGQLALAGAGDTFTGELTGQGGSIIDTAPLAAPIGIYTNTSFYGSTSLTTVDGFSGTVSPETFNVSNNATAPATMTVSDGINYASPSGGALAFDIGGPTSTSKIDVTGGTISLGDTTFSGTIVNGYTPTVGDIITLIQNNTGHAVNGTFLGLAQGATTTIGGTHYTVSYTGGTNHDDVTLTVPAAVVTNPTITSATTLTSTHGFSAGATVVATDTSAGGTAGLTYTWTATHVPAGGKTPTFNTNGKNSSGTVVARFFKDGTYNLLCTVKDQSGNTATAIVQVVVGQKASSLKVEPHGASVAKKGKEQFTATVLDQFAHPIRTSPTYVWSLPSGGGTISSAGLFTAGSVAEKVDIEVKADALSAIIGATVV